MFGERLKKARLEKELTQVQLAEAVGIAQATLAQIERGTRQASPPLVAEFATTLGCTADSLIFGEKQ